MIKTGGSSIFALANAAGTSRLTVSAQSLGLGSANLTGITSTASFATNTASGAQTMISTVNDAIGKVSTALAKLGTGSKALDMHLTFINKLQDSIDNGIGNLVDADLAKESAKIQSLQTRQQLGVQALAIANSSTQTLLSLFQ
jgi:flagellin